MRRVSVCPVGKARFRVSVGEMKLYTDAMWKNPLQIMDPGKHRDSAKPIYR